MAHRRKLANRLTTHFATFRSPSTDGLVRRRAVNWQTYAAVTGSALAMATNAAAGTIIWSGVQDVQAGPIASAEPGENNVSGNGHVVLVNGVGFWIGVNQGFGDGFANGAASLNGGFLTNAFLDNSNYFLKKLAGGAAISAGAGLFKSVGFAATQHFVSSPQDNPVQLNNFQNVQSGNWTSGKTGFAGFKFKTQVGQTSTSFAKALGAKTDYGWVRLVYTLGQDGLSNYLEAVDWAYDSGGDPIQAGDEGVPGTPEPSTFALALLASGAAGIMALRRRKTEQ